MENIKYPHYPDAQQDLRDLVMLIKNSWASAPEITLFWTTQVEFASKAADFRDAVNSRITAGADRPEETNTLENLDQQMEDHLNDLKGYCIGKWGIKNAPSHYAQFGIVHRNKSYIWPTDRNERRNALQMATDACNDAGFTAALSFPYGKEFWNDLHTAYQPALLAATATDGQVSSFIGTRDVLREYLVKAMDSLVLSIRANYPDTYRNTWRLWGWQTEDE